MKKIKAILLVAALLLVFAPAAAFAATPVGTETELKTAITNASAGETIILNADITDATTIEIPVGKEITIDLNGHDITGTSTQGSNYELIKNQGTLTITDSSSTPGTISFKYTGADSSWGWYSNTISNMGTLTVTGGVTVENTTAAYSSHIFFAIDNNSSARSAYLTVTGGATVSCANYRAIRQFANNGPTRTNEAVIDGATIEGQIWLNSPNNNDNKGSLTIKGDTTVTGNGKNNGRVVYVEAEKSNSFEVSIEDGEFNGPITVEKADTSTFDPAFVSGGTFSEDVSEFVSPDAAAASYTDESGETKYLVGEESITDAAQSATGGEIVVTQVPAGTDLDLTVGAGVAVTNGTNNGNVTVNDTVVDNGDTYKELVSPPTGDSYAVFMLLALCAAMLALGIAVAKKAVRA